MQNNSNNRDLIRQRVQDQIRNISSINQEEALCICEAHTSMLFAMISSVSETDEQFLNNITEYIQIAIKMQMERRSELRAQNKLK
jgi:hypothetical protein